MTQYLRVEMDQHRDQFLGRTRTSQDRVRAMNLIRKAAPGVAFKVDGGALVLERSTVIALRAQSASHILWSEDAARFVDMLARNYADVPRARQLLTRLQLPGEADRALGEYDLLQNLDPHQRVAVAAMTDPYVHGLCLFDEQGSGKTVMTVHAFDVLRKKGSAAALLIFAPKNMLGEWEKDFRRFTASSYKVSIIGGARSAKYLQLIERSDVYVTNYETAHSLESTLRSLIDRHKGEVVLVVDESFFVKNRSAKRSSAIRRLRTFAARCWILCGTPAPNDPLDVVHQFDIADGGITFSGVQLPDDPLELRRVIQRVVETRGVYLRRLKKDVLPDLPSKSFERVAVPMENQQHAIYGLALEGLVRDVKDASEEEFKERLPSFLGRRIALFEICSHPAQVVPSYDATPGKLLALDQLIDEFVGRRHEKVVIWSFFRYSLNQIFNRYQKWHPVRIDGTVSDVRLRSQAITQFQEDDSTMLFVGNPAAAGAGITLTKSRVAIYESFSIQTAHYLQSLDRIHRRGQTRDVSYYILLCEKSIEEDEYERLLMKEQSARELFQDNDPLPMTRDVFLGELLSAFKKL